MQESLNGPENMMTILSSGSVLRSNSRELLISPPQIISSAVSPVQNSHSQIPLSQDLGAVTLSIQPIPFSWSWRGQSSDFRIMMQDMFGEDSCAPRIWRLKFLSPTSPLWIAQHSLLIPISTWIGHSSSEDALSVFLHVSFIGFRICVTPSLQMNKIFLEYGDGRWIQLLLSSLNCK